MVPNPGEENRRRRRQDREENPRQRPDRARSEPRRPAQPRPRDQRHDHQRDARQVSPASEDGPVRGGASSDGVHRVRRRGVLVDGVTLAMSVPGSCRGWQRACRARCRVIMVPVHGGVRDSGCVPGRGGACCNTSVPWPGLAGAGEAGFMTETTGKICLRCCCAWMPVPWPLTWRPGPWRARRARPAWPRGDTAGNGRSGCAAAAPRGCGRGGRAAGPAAGPARPAAVLVRAAPRGRHRGHRRRGGPGHGRARPPAHRRGARRPGRHRARLAAPPARPCRAAARARHRRAERSRLLPARAAVKTLCLPKILSAQVGVAIWFRRGPDELVARRRSARCSMMDGCAAATGLPGCDERIRVTAASSRERPG